MGYSNQRKDIWMVFYLSLIVVAAAAAAAILDVIEQKLVDFPCKFRPLECEYNLLVYIFYLSWCKCKWFASAAAAAAAASNSYGHSGNDQEQFYVYIILMKILSKLF